MRHGAGLELIRGNVLEPLGEEAGDLHVEGRGPREGLCIPGPAEALVTLRAVGRHVHEVALLPPPDVVLQLIDQRIRRRELARRHHGRMDHDALEVLERERARKALHEHVTESLEREAWLEHFRAAAFQRVGDLLRRSPQVLGVEVALLIEYLGMMQCDRRAGGSRHRETHPAHHVLPHVDDGLS